MQKFKEIYLGPECPLLALLVDFAKQFSYTSILPSNAYDDQYGKYELIAAFGAYRIFQTEKDSFKELKSFYDSNHSWLFGHFSYDLKNELEDLASNHISAFNFPMASFFEPAYLMIQLKNSKTLELWYNEGVNPSGLDQLIDNIQSSSPVVNDELNLPEFSPKMSREEYVEAIEQLKKEIQYGNIYEINYCQEFFVKEVDLSPHNLFLRFNELSSMPFAAFYQAEDKFLMSASPERFLCKRGNQLIAQPIKGTAKRGITEEQDEQIKQDLKKDLKEQTENVMIVDLVRNDLSRTAAKASVKVTELFGVYTFPQVHQLISTVTSQLKTGVHFMDAIKYAFPMGSMTGAPKISAMKLIDQFEKTRRELYSGSVGYIAPNGDFDFNVVIRSFLYSSSKKRLSYSVGGAITNLSDPEKEYEECLLKAKAIFEL